MKKTLLLSTLFWSVLCGYKDKETSEQNQPIPEIKSCTGIAGAKTLFFTSSETKGAKSTDKSVSNLFFIDQNDETGAVVFRDAEGNPVNSETEFVKNLSENLVFVITTPKAHSFQTSMIPLQPEYLIVRKKDNKIFKFGLEDATNIFGGIVIASERNLYANLQTDNNNNIYIRPHRISETEAGLKVNKPLPDEIYNNTGSGMIYGSGIWCVDPSGNILFQSKSNELYYKKVSGQYISSNIPISGNFEEYFHFADAFYILEWNEIKEVEITNSEIKINETPLVTINGEISKFKVTKDQVSILTNSEVVSISKTGEVCRFNFAELLESTDVTMRSEAYYSFTDNAVIKKLDLSTKTVSTVFNGYDRSKYTLLSWNISLDEKSITLSLFDLQNGHSILAEVSTGTLNIVESIPTDQKQVTFEPIN